MVVEVTVVRAIATGDAQALVQVADLRAAPLADRVTVGTPLVGVEGLTGGEPCALARAALAFAPRRVRAVVVLPEQILVDVLAAHGDGSAGRRRATCHIAARFAGASVSTFISVAENQPMP